MSTATTASTSSREQVLDELRDGERFVLTTHEHPDGDALGSLAAMQQVLGALGKDAVSFLAADEFPLPYEYRFLELPQLVTAVPADVDERTVIFLDCGNIDRNPADGLKHAGADPQHRPPPRQHALRHARPRRARTRRARRRSIWDLMRGLGVELTQPIAEALYVGLVTDTGRFMYENTGSRAHVMAAELIDAGIDVHAIYRRLYEGIPQGKLELLARGLCAVERFDGGLLTVTQLTREDYAVDRRRRELLRGRRRPPALGRGHRGRGPGARPARPTARAPRARCRCARPTTASTSRRSPARRAAAGTAARPASRPTSSSPSSSRSCAAQLAEQL